MTDLDIETRKAWDDAWRKVQEAIDKVAECNYNSHQDDYYSANYGDEFINEETELRAMIIAWARLTKGEDHD